MGDKSSSSIHLKSTIGYIYISMAYLIWGFLALYWNTLQSVSSIEILCNRIIWGFIFLFTYMCLQNNKLVNFFSFLKNYQSNGKQLLLIFISSLAISGNWFIYIWAINFNHILDASIGLFITPLVSIFLGAIFLKDKINKQAWVSILLSFIAMLAIAYEYGSFPWIALSLAVSSGIYGLVKKYIRIDAMVGMCIETMMATPLAIIFYGLLIGSNRIFFASNVSITLLLIGGGILTALPLLWFTEGAKRLSLVTIGFFQYITPSITFLLSIFVFESTVSVIQWFAFLLIWFSLVLFSMKTRKIV